MQRECYFDLLDLRLLSKRPGVNCVTDQSYGIATSRSQVVPLTYIGQSILSKLVVSHGIHLRTLLDQI